MPSHKWAGPEGRGFSPAAKPGREGALAPDAKLLFRGRIFVGRVLNNSHPIVRLASIATNMIACLSNLRRNPQRVITCPSKS